MRTTLSAALPAALLCLFLACQHGTNDAAETASDTEADIQAIRTWFEGFTKGEIGQSSYHHRTSWTPDVVWLPPYAPAIIGRYDVLDYAMPFRDLDRTDREFRIEEIRIADQFAFAWVSSTGKAPSQAEGGRKGVEAKGLFIFRRTDDGRWLGSHCAWSTNAPDTAKPGVLVTLPCY